MRDHEVLGAIRRVQPCEVAYTEREQREDAQAVVDSLAEAGFVVVNRADLEAALGCGCCADLDALERINKQAGIEAYE